MMDNICSKLSNLANKTRTVQPELNQTQLPTFDFYYMEPLIVENSSISLVAVDNNTKLSANVLTTESTTLDDDWMTSSGDGSGFDNETKSINISRPTWNITDTSYFDIPGKLFFIQWNVIESIILDSVCHVCLSYDSFVRQVGREVVEGGGGRTHGPTAPAGLACLRPHSLQSLYLSGLCALTLGIIHNRSSANFMPIAIEVSRYLSCLEHTFT